MIKNIKIDTESRVPKYQQIIDSIIHNISIGNLVIDQKIPSISAASIIAKVSRDKFITRLAKNNKGYGWDQNFGYGTKQHLKAIKKLGINKHHRKTFSPVSKFKTHNI